ncbi:MAG: glycosyltransferase, partial [Rhodospirillaceae bacterium]
MKIPLLFDWGVSAIYGWGIYGLNLLKHWAQVAEAPAWCVGQVHLSSLGGTDPLTLRAIAPTLVASDQMRRRWTESVESRIPARYFEGVALHTLNNRFKGSLWPSEGGMIGSIATAGVIFFNDTHLPDAPRIAQEYAVIVAGSSWNQEVLRGCGVTNVAKVIQGVDPAVFHPAPKAGVLADRFCIFSGGKLEYRKAQDLVLLAFKAFAGRHPEAVLVCAWHSPWPRVALSLNVNPDIAPLSLDEQGQLDIGAWAVANGLKADQIIDIGSLPNHAMGRVLQEMDVALFPNRCEGGTNLVAMECMACGLPTIVSANTGHLDLVATGAPHALTRQKPLPVATGTAIGTDGWGESDVEEIVETLEQ